MKTILQLVVILTCLAVIAAGVYLFIPPKPALQTEQAETSAPRPFSDTTPKLTAGPQNVDSGEITDQWIPEASGEIIAVEVPSGTETIRRSENENRIPKKIPLTPPPATTPAPPATPTPPATPIPLTTKNDSYPQDINSDAYYPDNAPSRQVRQARQRKKYLRPADLWSPDTAPADQGDQSLAFNIGPEISSNVPIAEKILHRWGELTRDRLPSPAPLSPQKAPTGVLSSDESVLHFASGPRPRRVDVPWGQSARQVAKDLAARERCVAVVNIKLHSFAMPATHLSEVQWPLANRFGGPDISFTPAMGRIARIRPVPLALVDAAIDFDDPRLAHAVNANTGERPGNGIDDDSNGYIDDVKGYNFHLKSATLCESPDRFNHGSFIASLIAARPTGNVMDVIGLAPQCRIISAESLSSDKSFNPWRAEGDLAGVLEGIRYAMDRGAKVINLSLGARIDAQDLQAMSALPIWDELERRDILVVCAAGNDNVNIDTSPVFPASIRRRNIITVMAVDPDGQLGRTPHSKSVIGSDFRPFSNYGPVSVDIAAPGALVLGITSRGESALMSGTSFSAAYVSAAAALIRGKYPQMSAPQAIAKIVATARPMESLHGKCRCGAMLDINELLRR